MKIIIILLLFQTTTITKNTGDRFDNKFKVKIYSYFGNKFEAVDTSCFEEVIYLIMESEWSIASKIPSDPIVGLYVETKNFNIEFVFNSSIVTENPYNYKTYKELKIFRIMIFPKNDFIKGKEEEFRVFINKLMDLSKKK